MGYSMYLITLLLHKKMHQVAFYLVGAAGQTVTHVAAGIFLLPNVVVLDPSYIGRNLGNKSF